MKVLLVEDNPADYLAFQEALANGKAGVHEIEHAERLSAALERVTAQHFDLVLLDLTLPDSKGVQTLAAMHARSGDVPIVVLTASDDEHLAIDVLKHGAQDYLVKGMVQVYPDLLIRSMRYAVERKRAEQTLRRTEAMLVQAGKMSAIGQLASGIAHEVKNPLNIIQQSVTYLEPELTAKGGQALEILQVIRESVTTADRIIRGLLDLSRPAPLELKQTPLGDVIDASLLLVHNQLGMRHVQVIKDLAMDLPPLMLDANQMKQVFINLFLNSIHAMPNGGDITIRAAARPLTKAEIPTEGHGAGLFSPGERAVICEIEDTGRGIPAEILPHVFNPFFTTKSPGEGVGLGLSVTAAIVEGHRGLVHLESGEGRGTKATLLLPLG
jgi:signal transduction histidine kinase